VDAAVRQLQALGAHVEQVDPGFDDPLDICTDLWFAGAWTVWSGLTPAQQALADPDFRGRGDDRRLQRAALQQTAMRRGALGSHMRQFMQRWDLLVTPSVAVPAFDVPSPAAMAMTPEAMLGWTPYSYPFNLTQQPAITVPCGLTDDGLPIGLQIVGRCSTTRWCCVRRGPSRA
jgi:aspartyl-tRNA(Asn)/glutamyl-tRNA(Gln) amidotransferase subunit A